MSKDYFLPPFIFRRKRSCGRNSRNSTWQFVSTWQRNTKPDSPSAGPEHGYNQCEVRHMHSEGTVTITATVRQMSSPVKANSQFPHLCALISVQVALLMLQLVHDALLQTVTATLILNSKKHTALLWMFLKGCDFAQLVTGLTVAPCQWLFLCWAVGRQSTGYQ